MEEFDSTLIEDILNFTANLERGRPKPPKEARNLLLRLGEENSRTGARYVQGLRLARSRTGSAMNTMLQKEIAELAGLSTTKMAQQLSKNGVAEERKVIPGSAKATSIMISLAVDEGQSADNFLFGIKRKMVAPAILSIFLTYFDSIPVDAQSEIYVLLEKLYSNEGPFHRYISEEEIKQRLIEFYDERGIYRVKRQEVLSSQLIFRVLNGILSGSQDALPSTVINNISIICNVPADYFWFRDYTAFVETEWKSIDSGVTHLLDDRLKGIANKFVSLPIESRSLLVGEAFKAYAVDQDRWKPTRS